MTKTNTAKRPPVHGYRYPIFCGVVVGGLLGGITQSVSLALLFGGIAWAYFFFDFFHRLPEGGVSYEEVDQDAEDDFLRDEIHDGEASYFVHGGQVQSDVCDVRI